MPKTKRTLTPLTEVVSWGEVATSSELIERFVQRDYITPAAARKRLERVADSPQVWRSEHLVLPKNNRLFARRGFMRVPEFVTKVAAKVGDERPGLVRCLRAIERDGTLHEMQARKLLAAPAGETAAFPGFGRDLDALRELGMTVSGSGTNRFLSQRAAGETDEIIIGLRRECLLARIVASHLRKQNLLSWNGTELPTNDRLGADFNSQLFTAFGFSFLKPLVRQKAGKSSLTPCPVLIDVYSEKCSVEHVRSFIHRAERATLRRGKNHVYLGVIAARSFESDAWNHARGAGLLAINLIQLLGDEALEAMVIAERLLGGFQTQPATEEFNSLLASMKNLRTNPVVVDLYSIGFEAFTGFALRDEGYEAVTLNSIVPFQQTSRDVDVHGQRQDDLVVIECKAYHAKKEVSPTEVKKFFTETMPSFVRWWSGRNGNRQPKRVRAEIWTTGTFGQDAEGKLKELQLKPNVDAKLCNKVTLEQGLSFKIKSRLGQLLSAIAEGGEQAD